MVARLLLAALALVELVSSASQARPNTHARNAFMHFPVKAVKRANRPSDSSIANEFFTYTIEVSIGTPPQKTNIQVDTGSNELWVNPNCTSAPADFGEQALCENTPRYDPTQSTSGMGLNETGRIAYGTDGESLVGVVFNYYKDTIAFPGNLSITGQQYGVATDSFGMFAGILGLAPDMHNGFAVNESYPRVLDSLRDQGQIESRAYALALGKSEDTAGSLILGGYDRGRFSGPLATLPIVKSRDNVTRLTVEFTSIGITSTNDTSSTKKYKLGSDTNVMLDSGNTFNKLNDVYTDQIYADLNATIDASIGFPLVDCAKRNATGGLVMGFGDVSILVPYKELIFTAQGLCAVGVTSIPEGSQQTLGVPFLRAAYGKLSAPSRAAYLRIRWLILAAIFDWDNERIQIGQAANCASSIVSIGKGVDPATKGLCGAPSGSSPNTTSSSGSPTPTPSATSVPNAAVKSTLQGTLLGLVLLVSLIAM
ncbi:acid protease [Thozetella sp. PMI_491]|nr:acid protease [Thozetella sp. PMI_491]